MTELPSWITYPEDDWVQITPEQAGLDPEKWHAFLSALDVRGARFGGEDHSAGKWGTVLTRGGYLLHSWGDRHYAYQTASTGKAFIWALLGLAVEDGLIELDQPIGLSWTGHGELSHTHKWLDRGHHRNLTWRHLAGTRFGSGHHGGFPIELGNRWQQKQTGLEDADVVPGVPSWATWTGDPFYDLYAHAEPGTEEFYSSAGYWRLGQALTAVFERDLKDVLQERLFSKIGIGAERWEWLTGREVKDQRDLYPTIPDSYTYLDPPYEIAGSAVRSGPGWVIITASDLARFGHLVATEGIWRGERLISREWVRGHGGGNESGVSAESTYFTAIAVVTTIGLHPDFPRSHKITQASFIPEDIFSGPVRVEETADKVPDVDH